MKYTENIAQGVIITVLVVAALSGLILTKEYLGWVTYHSGEGGGIYEISIDLRSPAFLWAGIYGVGVRIPGFTEDAYFELEGGDTLEANLLFDCLEPDIPHEVYASLKQSYEIDFASLQPATAAEIDAYLQMSQFDSFVQLMSAVNTYTQTMNVTTGVIGNIVPATYTYRIAEDPPATFDTGIMKDGNGTLVFVAHINDNFTKGFNNRVYNYQMLIPIPNASTQLMYFFTDPNDQCPGGEGELPNPGDIEGTVTTSGGNPIEDVIIDIAGSSTSTDITGFYNLSIPAGNYRLYAVKTGFEVYFANITITINETLVHNIVMIPRPEGQLTGVGPGQDEPGDDDGPGEAPKVPIVEKPKQIEGIDYIISLNAINRKIRQGNFLQEAIQLFSFKETTAQTKIEITGSVADMIELDYSNLLISPNTMEVVTLTIFGRGTPGFYNGTVKITGDLNASIPINLELLSKDQLPVQALLMDIDVAKKDLHPSDSLRFKTDLKNMLSDQEYPVALYYTVQDEEGKETIWTYSTNVYLRTAFSLLKTFKLPKDVPEGVYVLRVTATYLDLNSATSVVFSVVTPFLFRIFLGFFMWQWIIAIGILLALVGTGIGIKLKIESQKRFHLKVDYKELPKPGPRSGWWGKIAETDRKTYFDIEQLKIHSIVAGSTGSGKSISAQTIVEECLLHDIAVIVFDPTAQWTGMLRPCKEPGMLKFYEGFGMKKKDARSFNGNVRLLTNPREVIKLTDYMKPGEIQIFAMNKLQPKDIDVVVANTIRQVFKEDFKETPNLKLLLVYDEIHRILPKFGGSGEGFVQIERGCREFRKWGVGVLLVSQVLGDFLGEIKANINTEVQMRTRDEGDLERLKTKYGDSVLKSLVKSTVGTGMVQNGSYNHGKPFFVSFRPILHSVIRLTDEELEKYNKYNEEIEQLYYEFDQLEGFGKDVFDMRLELKLSLDKVKSGNFNMVEVYLEGLIPRVKKEWEKLGKTPKKLVKEEVSDDEMKESLVAAKKSKEEAKANEKPADDEKKEEENLYAKEVSPDYILSLSNGMLVLSAKSLYDELDAMKQSDFEQHVNDDKNDFGDWIKGAVGAKKVAERIYLTKDKKEIMDLLLVLKDKKKLPPLTDEQKKMKETLKWFDATDDDSKSEEKKVDKKEAKSSENEEESDEREEEKKEESENEESSEPDDRLSEDSEHNNEQPPEEIHSESEPGSKPEDNNTENNEEHKEDQSSESIESPSETDNNEENKTEEEHDEGDNRSENNG